MFYLRHQAAFIYFYHTSLDMALAAVETSMQNDPLPKEHRLNEATNLSVRGFHLSKHNCFQTHARQLSR